MFCIQVPVREIICPPKNNWKLRWRKARRVVRTLSLCDGEGALGSADSGDVTVSIFLVPYYSNVPLARALCVMDPEQ
jgi:hypothetical protein